VFFPPPPVHPLEVGEIDFDPSTIHTVGLSLPVLRGDEDFDAMVQVSYRPAGSSLWKNALPLQRVRTKTLSRPDPTPFPIAEQFAGSIFGLEADRAYELKLDIADPDGARITKMGTIRTRPLPPDNPMVAHTIPVQSSRALAEALSAAKPGDVIELAAGIYRGPIKIERSGTAEDPIILRGVDRDHTILEAPGADYALTITGSHVIVEQMTIRRSAWGVRITNVSNVIVRRTAITEVKYGINAAGGANRDIYICDNLLTGVGVIWPDYSSKTWDFEGIVVTGTGHVICHNTLSGFGDALGLSQHTEIPNRAIDFYGNDVLWGGDDGIELDYSERNVRAFENRFGNVGMGISFQPIWGGPAYAFRNVIYNTANAPYKLNQDPSGFYIVHNTAIRPGWAWTQYGHTVSNFSFCNNLTIGTENAVHVQPILRFAHIDYNGWAPDGQFTFRDTWETFAELREDSPYEQHGVLLRQPIFYEVIKIPAQFAAFMYPPASVRLDPTSNAVDAGMKLPNINDGFTGQAPDLGALEQGHPAPHYGVRLTGEPHTLATTAP
jgi:Chondroitinase B